MSDILDIRDLADEWQTTLDDIEDRSTNGALLTSDAAVEINEANDHYGELCDELNIPRDPASLRHYGDNYEPTLIAESYFTEYAQQLAEDIAPYSAGSEVSQVLDSWPYRCIDWEAAADELKYDYSLVRFDGDEYYIRSV